MEFLNLLVKDFRIKINFRALEIIKKFVSILNKENQKS